MYEFDAPQETAESLNFRFFDSRLEDDPNVLFHATKTENLQSIVHNGLSPAIERGGKLETISYAESSADAMSHWNTRRKDDEEWCILALRFPDRSELHIHDGVTRSLALRRQPEIVAKMRLPAGHIYR